MVGINEYSAVGQRVLGGVGERKRRSLEAQGAHDGLVRDSPQRQQHRIRRQAAEFGGEVLIAASHLGADRLILRRHALDGVRNPAAKQLETVIDGTGLRRGAESVAIERIVKDYAGVIAGKRPTGRIGSMKPRSQTDDQQTGLIISKRWNRTREIVRILLANAIEIIR